MGCAVFYMLREENQFFHFADTSLVLFTTKTKKNSTISNLGNYFHENEKSQILSHGTGQIAFWSYLVELKQKAQERVQQHTSKDPTTSGNIYGWSEDRSRCKTVRKKYPIFTAELYINFGIVKMIMEHRDQAIVASAVTVVSGKCAEFPDQRPLSPIYAVKCIGRRRSLEVN